VRAVVVRRHGGPEVLELCDWPDPHAGPGEVVIGVRAVTVGRTLDVEARARGADFDAKLPRVPGSDPAGVVLEAGAGVSRFAPGDRAVCTSTLFCGRCASCIAGRTHACEHHRVVGVHIDGGDAERVAIPDASVELIPHGVGFEQAAAMSVSYPVAWNLLREQARVQPGEVVLVMGAGGALGIAGVLVARTLGARVIAAAASDWKLERVRALLVPTPPSTTAHPAGPTASTGSTSSSRTSPRRASSAPRSLRCGPTAGSSPAAPTAATARFR
jgi:propanol-preferring alcohol dehydrogenase